MTTKSRRRVLLIGALTVTAALSLAACATPDAPTGGSDSGNAVTGPVEFVYPGTSDVERSFAESFVKAEEAKHEGLDITIDYLSWNDMQKTLAIRVQAKNPPDLTATQDITQLVGQDGLADLNDYLGKDAIDPKSFLPGTVDYSTIDGKLYSVPYLATAFTLIVNEKLLNAAGFKIEDLTSWDAIEKAAKAMTSGDVYGFAYPLGNPRFAFRGALTAAYSDGLEMNDVSTAAQGKWAELLEHMKALRPYSPDAETTWDYADMWRAFANGQLGMVAGGTYYTANVYSINPAIVADTRQISYPAGPSSDSPRTPVSSVGYAMFNGAKNPAAAWALIKSLTSPENALAQAAAVNLPAAVDVDRDALYAAAAKVYPDAAAGNKQIIEDGFTAVENNGVTLTKIPGQPDMEPVLQDIMVRYLAGQLTTDAAVKEIVDKIGQINKDYGN